MYPQINKNPYHVDVLLSTLTRNIAAKLDDIRDEMEHAFQQFLPVTEGRNCNPFVCITFFPIPLQIGPNTRIFRSSFPKLSYAPRTEYSSDFLSVRPTDRPLA